MATRIPDDGVMMPTRFVALFAVVSTLACTGGPHAGPTRPATRADAEARGSNRISGCEFSSGPKSTLAWESGVAPGLGPATPVPRDVIIGRVIAVRNGQGIGGAGIRLDPGNHIVESDKDGRFAFPPLPQGRYTVTVMLLGVGTVADSVTLGFDGLRIVAAISGYRGDVGCDVPAPKSSNER